MMEKKPDDGGTTRLRDQQQLGAALVALEIRGDFERVAAEAGQLGEQAQLFGGHGLALWAEITMLDALARTSERADHVPARAQQILEWAVRHGDNRLASRCHALLAMVSITAGHLGPGAEHATIAVSLLDGSEHPRLRAKFLTRQAVGLFVAGIFDEGLEVSRRASAVATELADHELLAHIASNAFEAALDHGTDAESGQWLGLLQEALDGAPHLGHQFNDVLARGHLAADRPEEALAVLALIEPDLVDSFPDELKAANRLVTARAHRQAGNSGDARAALDQVQQIVDAGDLPEIEVAVLEERAALAAAQGDFATAYAFHRQFHDTAARQWLNVRRSQVEYLFAIQRVEEAFERAVQAEAVVLVDPLTGAHNRRWVQESLPQLLEVWERDPGVVHLVAILDIDHFKDVNDTYGHLVGDDVLVGVAQRLQNCRLVESVARIGGEEFLLLCASGSSPGQVATSVLGAVRALDWDSPHGRVRVTASLGFAAHRPGRRVEDLLMEADRNLYRAKHAGRDTARATSDS